MVKNGLIVLLFCVFIEAHSFITFDESMMVHNVNPSQLPLTKQLIPRARELYNRYNPYTIAPKKQPVIPKIIHHVWLGKPLSQEDKELRKTWFAFHPDYQFILWTDRIENDNDAWVVNSLDQLYDALYVRHEQRIVIDVAAIPFDNRSFYDEAINYGEKSDILKYEIVYQLGGMYVDCDFECLKSFNDLFDRYDFFTGVQPFDTNFEQLGAALFGAKPQHPILHHAISTIKNDHHYVPIVVRTGPIHFTRSFIAIAGLCNNVDIAFPATFFYPCGYNQRGQDRHVWLQSESYAVHHWAGSWLGQDAFVR